MLGARERLVDEIVSYIDVVLIIDSNGEAAPSIVTNKQQQYVDDSHASAVSYEEVVGLLLYYTEEI